MTRLHLNVKVARLNEKLAALGKPAVELDYYRLAGGYDLIVSGASHSRTNSKRLSAKAMGLYLDGLNLGLAWAVA